MHDKNQKYRMLYLWQIYSPTSHSEEIHSD